MLTCAAHRVSSTDIDLSQRPRYSSDTRAPLAALWVQYPIEKSARRLECPPPDAAHCFPASSDADSPLIPEW